MAFAPPPIPTTPNPPLFPVRQGFGADQGRCPCGAQAAQAATQTATQTTGTSWGKYFSSDHKACTFGKTWKSGGKVVGPWSGHGIQKVYTYTCWAGEFDNCGRKYRIH